MRVLMLGAVQHTVPGGIDIVDTLDGPELHFPNELGHQAEWIGLDESHTPLDTDEFLAFVRKE